MYFEKEIMETLYKATSSVAVCRKYFIGKKVYKAFTAPLKVYHRTSSS